MAATFLTGGGGGGVQGKRLRKWEKFTTAGIAKRGGMASIIPYQWALSTLTNATAATFATVLVPNANVVAGIRFTVLAGLGDGDAAEVTEWTVAISRIAGANALIDWSVAAVQSQVAGATANATVTLTNVAVAGGVAALNSFALTVAVARSAGAADNHFALIEARLFNMLSGGAYI